MANLRRVTIGLAICASSVPSDAFSFSSLPSFRPRFGFRPPVAPRDPIRRVASQESLLKLRAQNAPDLGATGAADVLLSQNMASSMGNVGSQGAIQKQSATSSKDVLTGGKLPAPKGTNPHELSTQQAVYMWLSALFVACLLIADVIGVKLFQFTLPFEILGAKTVDHTCGMLTFPITFILGDVINEYFGQKAARQTVYMGLAMSVLAFIVINIAQFTPALDAPYNVSQEAFDIIFGSSKMLYIASLIAYTVGNLSDIYLFSVFKKLTGGKLLWLRATGSTVISQMLDSFVVTYLAFGIGKTMTGQIGATFPEVLKIAATGYGLKFFLAICTTPAIYWSKSFFQKNFGLEPIPPEDATKVD